MTVFPRYSPCELNQPTLTANPFSKIGGRERLSLKKRSMHCPATVFEIREGNMEQNLNNGGLLLSVMALKDSLSPQARYLTRANDAHTISARIVAGARK